MVSDSDRVRVVGQRALVVMSAATGHTRNCVCVSCLATRASITELEGMLRTERTRADSIVRLDTYQRRLLHTFVSRWNETRKARGLSPVLAHDALTRGLESLIAMIGQE